MAPPGSAPVRRLTSSLLLVLVLVLAAAGPAKASPPRRVFLWYADGSPPPPTSPPLCHQTPPRYRCSFADTPEACRQAVQVWLDRWYADFDLVFTYQRPDEGDHDTIIVASEASWCLGDERTTSRSPAPTCDGVPKGAVAVFQCGSDARRCASIIAQEQAHLVGLGHTSSVTDVMNSSFPSAHDGFEDLDNSTTSLPCRRIQNSYRLMLERLGPWPGGPKPSPEPPSAGSDAGQADAEVVAEPDGPADDASDANTHPPARGCDCTLSSAPAGGLPANPGVVLLALALLRRIRRR